MVLFHLILYKIWILMIVFLSSGKLLFTFLTCCVQRSVGPITKPYKEWLCHYCSMGKKIMFIIDLTFDILLQQKLYQKVEYIEILLWNCRYLKVFVILKLCQSFIALHQNCLNWRINLQIDILCNVSSSTLSTNQELKWNTWFSFLHPVH